MVSLTGLIGILAAWAVSVFTVLLVAATTDVGPVVLELTGRHGVHAGDVLAALAGAAVAVAATASIVVPGATDDR